MSVLMKMLSLFLAVLLMLMVLYSFSLCQPVILVYLVHLMLIIELLLVLCVLSNNEHFA